MVKPFVSNKSVRKLLRSMVPLDWPSHGGIYFVRAEYRLKIGFATDIDRRLRELQVGSPTPLNLLAHTGGGRAQERELHERFIASRCTGEWFNITGPVVAYVAWIRGGLPAQHLPMVEVAGEILDGNLPRIEAVDYARRMLEASA